MKKLRDWWVSLDDAWQRIFIINYGLEHEMGGVKNYINDYQWDYKKIKNLYEEGALDNYIISENEITDDSIEKIVNLKEIIFEDEGITDLTPLVKLESLEILNCPHNKIINIDPLKNLPNLQELNLAFNNITTIEPLKNLMSLRNLELTWNNVVRLEPIANLENLEILSCPYNWETNYGPELIIQLSSKWKKLRKLAAPHISSTQKLVKFCPDLENLYIQGTDIDLADIIKLKRLKVLNLDGVNSYKSDSLIELPELENLTVRVLDADLSYIVKLKQLKVLCIDRSIVSNLDPLVELTNLTTLTCNNTFRIETIEPLSYLHKLERLECFENKIVDLSHLRKLKKLKFLNFGYNKIESLKPLEDLTELQHLYCRNNKINSIRPLKNLSKLKQVICENNPIPLEEIEMLKTALPKCEVIFQNQ